MSKLYTVQEVAEKLKVSQGTVRNYLSQGRIRYVKVLGNTRVTEEELKRIIKPVSKGE